METCTGIIVSVLRKRNYGFIQMDKGEQVFFHAAGLITPPSFDDLKEGMPVEFFLMEKDGRKKAIGVVVQ